MASQRNRTARIGAVVRPLVAVLIVATNLVLVPGSANAAPGDARPMLAEKTTPQTTAGPGDTVQYVVNFSCSNNEATADGCDGSVFVDPLPRFTDVHGNLVPVEYVSASGPASVWPGGFTLNTADPLNPYVTGTAGVWPPGNSGSIFVTVRVPRGTVPVAPQDIENTAIITDPDIPGYSDASTTATTTISATAPDWTISKIGPTSTRMNRNVTWVVSVCGPATSALFPSYSVTDTLPPGLQFVSASNSGSYTDDQVEPAPADSTSDGAGVVTWTFDAANRPPLGSDGCFRMNVTGRFPSGYVDPASADPANDDNIGDARKTDLATGVGGPTSGDPTAGLGAATWTTTLIGAVFGIGDGGTTKRFTDTSGADNFYTVVGDTGRFNLSGSIDSDLPADRLVISDGSWSFNNGATTTNGTGMPESFAPTQVRPGTWNAPITATIEGSDDGFATPVVIASDVESGDPTITLATPFRSIRWVWGDGPDSVPNDFAATGLQIIGSLGTPPPTTDDFGLYTNTSTMTVTRGEASFTDTDSDQYILETPQPHARIDKSVTNPSRRPGQTTTYTLRVSNSADATGVLTDPYVEDCVPDFFTLQGSPTLGAGWTAGTPLPSCGAGQTPLRFDYSGTLDPGDSTSEVTYVVQVDTEVPGPITPPGAYTNTATVRPPGGDSFGHCANTSPSCADTATVTVDPVVELNSQKCVRGDLDDGVFRPSPSCQTDPSGTVLVAETLPGGLMEWEVRLRNSGNTDATNVEFVDLLPRVGDTAVITETGGVLNPRRSEYTPYLVTPITAPPGWTVSYSTSANPCRPEVGGVNNPGSNCEVPNWVTNPSFLDLPTYRSVKFSFIGTLALGTTASFAWSTRAPVFDPTYDQGGTSSIDPYEFLDGCTAQTPRTDPSHCPRAVNSFAYGADATNLPVGVPQPTRLFAEPPQVEVRVTAPPTPNGIGNRVWFDRNYDGIQGADRSATGEPGVPGVYVELYQYDSVIPGGAYNLVGYTFTDAEGHYLFSGGEDGLADGTYKLRVVPLSDYYVSPADQTGSPTDQGAPGAGPNPGTNTDDDSDVPRFPTGTGPFGEYHDTVDVVLGDNNNSLPGLSVGEFDPTWDVGIWNARPAVEVVKVTKDSAWPDVQSGDGVSILRGRPVTWTYTVTNTGDTRLEDVTLTDDGGPDPSFGVSNCAITTQGTNADGLTSSANAPIALNRGATMRCTATGTAGSADYTNNAAVVGTPVLDDDSPILKGDPPATVTDTDPSSYLSGKYDLALAKTAGTLDLSTGNVPYTITVRNEGTVASGAFQVTDVLPAGMSLVGNASPVQTSSAGGTIVWNRPSLNPGSNASITFTAHVDDYLARPYRNYAEISDDSADLVPTGGVPTPTSDWDSVPDADITNDNIGNGVATGNGYGPVGSPNSSVDNANITQAGSRLKPDSGDDPLDGQDDADIADISPVITYDLALAKVPSNDPVGLGAAPSFTVRVYNQGNVPSGPVTVIDRLPTGLTFRAAGSTGGCSAGTGNTVSCAITNIAPGASTVLTLATTIDGTPDDFSTAPWRNWAEIASDSAQTLYGVDDTDSQPELTENDGTGADGTLPGDAYTGITTAGSTYATPTGPDEDDNDDGTVTTTVRYDLALAKTVESIDPGTGLMDMTVTVTNQGTVASGGYSVRDTMPPGVDLVDDSATPTPTTTTGSPATGVVLDWTDLPSLDPGDSTTLTYTVRITDYRERPFRNVAEITDDDAFELYRLADADSVPDDAIDNDGDYGPIGSSPIDNTSIGDAGVIGGDPSDDADIADAIVPVTYDLALAKTADATFVTQFDEITYTITVQNQGNVPSGEFTVTDTVPSGLDFARSDDGGNHTPGAPATVTFDSDDLAPGETATFTWVAEVTDVTLRPFRNVAEISSDSAQTLYGVDDIDSTPDTIIDDDGDYGPKGSISPIDNTSIGDAGVIGGDPSDDADIADVDLEDLVYDLALSKVVDAPSVAYDDEVTYEVTVQNQGNLASREFVVTDWIPAGMTVADLGGATDNGDGTVEWTIDDLAPGDSVTLTLRTRISDMTQRPFRNVAEITSDGADTYDVTVGNLVDVEDQDSTPDTDRSNDGNYGPVGGLDAIDNVGGDAIGDAGLADDPSDDADIADVDVPVLYDLALVKTGPASMTPLGTTTFTIRVLNQGNVPSGPFSVRDAVPAGMVATAASDGGSLSTPDTAVLWNGLPSLDPGATAELTVTMRITDLTLRPFLNTAEISADSASLYDVPERADEAGRPATPDELVPDDDSAPDEDPANDVTEDQTALPVERRNDPAVDEDDHDIAPITTSINYDLALVKTIPSGQDYARGSVITYQIKVRNQGNVPSGSYSVNDVIPAGMSFVGADRGGRNQGVSVVWTDLPSLAPLTTTVLTLQLRLDDVTLPSYVNTAEISADSADDYSTPADPVTDDDSRPDDDTTNDDVIDTDDVDIDVLFGDEDDHDIAALDMSLVLAANSANSADPPTTPAASPAPLAMTGSGSTSLLQLATILILAGAAIGLLARRRRSH